MAGGVVILWGEVGEGRGCSLWVEVSGLVIGLIETDLEGFENSGPPPFGWWCFDVGVVGLVSRCVVWVNGEGESRL